jgi:uncharacterized alpha-E superfamily protein
MLSRVADSIFWVNRYIERAENVARFVDVNFHLILDGAMGKREHWQPLVDVTGDHDAFKKRYAKATRDNVIQFLTFDTENPNSIVSCVRAARENARTVRDTITSDMWEQINTFYLMMQDASARQRAAETPYDFFSQVKQAAHMFVGITDATMAHGEGWHFGCMGRNLERCDKITRILDVNYYLLKNITVDDRASQENLQWAAVLKSASALEMYRKKVRKITAEGVVDFLLLDRAFPRAALHCLNTVDQSLHAITGQARYSFSCPAERKLGQLCAELAFADIHDIIKSGLHVYIDNLQDKVNVIGQAVSETFFSMKMPGAPIIETPPTVSPTQSQSQSQTAKVAEAAAPKA